MKGLWEAFWIDAQVPSGGSTSRCSLTEDDHGDRLRASGRALRNGHEDPTCCRDLFKHIRGEIIDQHAPGSAPGRRARGAGEFGDRNGDPILSTGVAEETTMAGGLTHAARWTIFSIEATIAGSHWSVFQRLELPPLDLETIPPREEILNAQKAAAEDAKGGKSKGGKSKEVAQ